LDHYLVDGLLRFQNLPDDWWDVDPTKGAVIGERSGYRITVGDRLKVIIGRIHLPTRELELGLAEPMGKQGLRKVRERERAGTDRKPFHRRKREPGGRRRVAFEARNNRVRSARRRK